MKQERWTGVLTGRRHVCAAVLGVALFLGGCGGVASVGNQMGAMPMGASAAGALATATAPNAAPVAVTSVSIQNFAFSPPVITVAVGATVTWTNKDIEQHTATARDKTFNSDVLSTDKSYSFTFTKAGTYDYNCLIHPDMVGKVIVTP